MKSLKEINKIKNYEKRVRALDKRAEELMRQCDWSYLSELEWVDIKTQESWEKAKKTALKDYFRGKFLLNYIGGIKTNRPYLIAVLLQQRLAWIEEYDLRTIPELILLDFAFISYYHFIRNSLIVSNLQWIVNFEFFERENPKLKYDKKYQLEGFSAEEHIQEMIEMIKTSLEMFNRMFLRNLKALRDLKRSNQILNIGNISQLNIGDKQVNINKPDRALKNPKKIL